MQKLLPIAQLIISAVMFVIGLATAANLILLTMRPETISVVNAIIGQGVVIIALLAFSRIMFRKGKAGLSTEEIQAETE
jgi:hypothetical protein